MKKFFLAAGMIAVGALFSGCSIGKTQKVTIDDRETVPVTETTTTLTTTAVTTQASSGTTTSSGAKPTAQKVKLPTEGVVLYDNAGMFSDAEKKNIGDYLDKLSTEYMLNAAVVTTDKLGGKEPYEYAEETYGKIFKDGGDGLLLLFNNDTYNDVFYKSEYLGKFITQDDEDLAFVEATPMIVNGECEKAAMRILNLAEYAPSHVFDNAGVFDAEQIEKLEKAASGSGEEISFATVAGTTDPELGNELCKRRYPAKNGTLILLNTAAKKITLHSEGEISETLKNSVSAANKMNGDHFAKACTALGAE